MSFLSRLFGSKPKTAAPVATAAPKVRKISPSEMSVEDLVNVIKSQDYSIDAKVEAIEALPYNDNLVKLAVSGDTPQLQSASAKRIAKLLDDSGVTIEQVNNDINDDQHCLAITSYCKNSDFITRLIEKNEDESQLHTLAVSGSTSKTRQAAAARISSIDVLQKLLKEAKSKDKNVYKIVKDKLDKYRAEQKAKEQRQAQQTSICEALEKLVSTIDLSTFESRIAHYEKQWEAANSSTDNEDSELSNRFSQGLAACKTRLAEIQKEYQEELAKKEAENEAKEAFGKIQQDLKAFIRQLYNETEINIDFANQSNEFVKAKQDEWHQALAHNKPSKKQFEFYNQAIESIGYLIINLSQQGSLQAHISSLLSKNDNDSETEKEQNSEQQLLDLLAPANLLEEVDVPEIVINARTAIKDYEAKQAELRDQENTNIKKLSGLINSAKKAVAQGNLRQASGVRKAIQEKLDVIHSVPARMQEKVEDLDIDLNKLQDYRNFATEPKKLELIEAMEKLANLSKQDNEEGTIIDPENLADQIKKLQSDWKELVYGGKDTQPELWEKFHEFSQIAYEPCKAFFSDKAEERKANIQKRSALVEQLTEYNEKYNWEKADWKEVETVIRAAKNEWSTYTPVDRSANAKVQTAFNNILKTLQHYIDTEYEKNRDKKRVIITQAEALTSNEDIQAAIQQVKNLQAQWKNSGRTWQKDENKLWKEFRVHCDAIFDRKQKETDSFKAELAENKSKADDICAQIEAIAQTEGKEITEKRAEVSELEEQFKAITPLPKNAEKAIKERLERAIERFHNAIDQFRAKQEQSTWDKVFEIKSKLNTWQNNCIDNGADAETSADSLKEVEEAMQQIETWPTSTKGILEKQIAQTASEDNREEAAKQLRLICIRSEIALEKDSPSEDQAIRMEYQVNRLKEGMTSSVTSSKHELINELKREWLDSEAVATTEYTTLLNRFNNNIAL